LKGKKGNKRREKRCIELGILQLFEKEGQKRLKADADKQGNFKESIEKNAETTNKLTTEINKPFSHTLPVQCPPPYEMNTKCMDIYPQLPMINQEGKYYIEDDEERVIETGKAKTTIPMYPSSRSKTGKRPKNQKNIGKGGDKRQRTFKEETLGGCGR